MACLPVSPGLAQTARIVTEPDKPGTIVWEDQSTSTFQASIEPTYVREETLTKYNVDPCVVYADKLPIDMTALPMFTAAVPSEPCELKVAFEAPWFVWFDGESRHPFKVFMQVYSVQAPITMNGRVVGTLLLPDVKSWWQGLFRGFIVDPCISTGEIEV
jgi:hypothetical protein